MEADIHPAFNKGENALNAVAPPEDAVAIYVPVELTNALDEKEGSMLHPNEKDPKSALLVPKAEFLAATDEFDAQKMESENVYAKFDALNAEFDAAYARFEA